MALKRTATLIILIGAATMFGAASAAAPPSATYCDSHSCLTWSVLSSCEAGPFWGVAGGSAGLGLRPADAAQALPWVRAHNYYVFMFTSAVFYLLTCPLSGNFGFVLLPFVGIRRQRQYRGGCIS